MSLRTASLALATTLAFGVPAAAAAPEMPVPAETTRAKTPRASQVDASRYAEREQRDQTAGEFQGGDVLVISLSGGAIIVILLLLLVLA